MMRIAVMIWAMCTAWVLASGCSSLPKWAPVDLKSNYRMDASISVNAMTGIGAFLIDHAPVYNFQIKTQENVDLLLLSSCHRELSIDKKADNFKLSITPEPIELEDYCPISIYALNKTGYSVLGLVIPKNGDYALPAHLVCNGTDANNVGWSLCQSRSGLYQELDFTEAVTLPHANSCNQSFDLSPDGKRLRWTTTDGNCLFVIKGVSGQKHLLMTYGYSKFLFGS